MLFDILQTITDFVVLMTRLTTEDLADEQRMILIDHLIHLQGLEAAFQFDLHDLLMILITMLSTSFGWRGIVRTVGRIADSNRAQALERHRSLHALKKLGNPEDAAEFMRCLNAICEEGDARYPQVAASYYYGEIAERGAGSVLKEMALIAMHLASLNPVTDEVETDSEIAYALREGSKPRSFFNREVAAINRMIRGRRKGAGFVHDEWTEWLNDLEANGATVDELDDAFAHV